LGKESEIISEARDFLERIQDIFLSARELCPAAREIRLLPLVFDPVRSILLGAYFRLNKYRILLFKYTVELSIPP